MISWDISVFRTDMLWLAINSLPVLHTHKKLVYSYTTSGYFKIIITPVSTPAYWMERLAIWKFIIPAMFHLILEWPKSCLDKEVATKKNTTEARGNCEIDGEAYISGGSDEGNIFQSPNQWTRKTICNCIESHPKLHSKELIYSNNKDSCFYLFFFLSNGWKRWLFLKIFKMISWKSPQENQGSHLIKWSEEKDVITSGLLIPFREYFCEDRRWFHPNWSR